MRCECPEHTSPCSNKPVMLVSDTETSQTISLCRPCSAIWAVDYIESCIEAQHADFIHNVVEPSLVANEMTTELASAVINLMQSTGWPMEFAIAGLKGLLKGDD